MFFKKIQKLKKSEVTDEEELKKFIDEKIGQYGAHNNKVIRMRNFVRESDLNRIKVKYFLNFKNRNISFLSPIEFKSHE